MNMIVCYILKLFLVLLPDVPLMPVSELDDIPDTFCNVFDRNKSVGVLKCNHVEGWDVKLFQPSHQSSSRKRRRVTGSVKDDSDISVTCDEQSPPQHLRSNSHSFPTPELSPRTISDTLSLNMGVEGAGDDGGKAKQIGSTGARFVFPSNLRITSTDESLDICQKPTTVLSDNIGPLEQFVFECSANELLEMDQNLLARIVEFPHFNDLRTIFLAHDKRMLSVLSLPDILCDYASTEDANVLKDHIIPTFVVGVHSVVVKEAKEQQTNWILKPNAGGKGVGIVFGRDCVSATEWAALLDDPAHQTYVLQRVVEQQQVDITTATGSSKMLVVGLLHCFNNHFLGMLHIVSKVFEIYLTVLNFSFRSWDISRL
jgi:hypothetical protein